MLRREHHVGRAVERVGARGEDFEGSASFQLAACLGLQAGSLRYLENYRRAFAFPDPVALQQLDRLGPIERFEFVDQALGKRGDAQHPLPHRPAHDGETRRLRSCRR